MEKSDLDSPRRKTLLIFPDMRAPDCFRFPSRDAFSEFPLSPPRASGEGSGVGRRQDLNIQIPPAADPTPNPSPRRGEGNATMLQPHFGAWVASKNVLVLQEAALAAIAEDRSKGRVVSRDAGGNGQILFPEFR